MRKKSKTNNKTKKQKTNERKRSMGSVYGRAKEKETQEEIGAHKMACKGKKGKGKGRGK